MRKKRAQPAAPKVVPIIPPNEQDYSLDPPIVPQPGTVMDRPEAIPQPGLGTFLLRFGRAVWSLFG